MCIFYIIIFCWGFILLIIIFKISNFSNWQKLKNFRLLEIYFVMKQKINFSKLQIHFLLWILEKLFKVKLTKQISIYFKIKCKLFSSIWFKESLFEFEYSKWITQTNLIWFYSQQVFKFCFNSFQKTVYHRFYRLLFNELSILLTKITITEVEYFIL